MSGWRAAGLPAAGVGGEERAGPSPLGEEREEEPPHRNLLSAGSRLLFHSQAKTLINAPAMTQNASRAEKRGDSPSGGAAPARPGQTPPSQEHPPIPSPTPTDPPTLFPTPTHPPPPPRLRGAASDALSRLCLGQTERLRQRWDVFNDSLAQGSAYLFKKWK